MNRRGAAAAGGTEVNQRHMDDALPTLDPNPFRMRAYGDLARGCGGE